jgi:hypothetical protein
MTTGKINFKVIMWTVEIISVVALFVMLLFFSVQITERFTPEQMDLFHRAMDNRVMAPVCGIMFAFFVPTGYLMLNIYRWQHRSDIKELKLKIKQLEAGEETV